MKRRRQLVAFIAACVAGVPSVRAQTAAKTPRIAVVFPEFPAVYASEITQKFERRLRQLGYEEGRNIHIERRSAQGQPQLLPVLMKEVVDLRVDVIVTVGTGASEARRATSTIPIVAITDYPIEGGLTASLSRPTANVTGATGTSGFSMIGKSLQLLKQAVPNSRRVAVLDFKYVDAAVTPTTHQRRMAAEAAARDLGITLIAVGVNSAEDFEQAFALIDKERADAVMDMSTEVTATHRRRTIDFAAQRRLPTIFSCRVCVEEGGLMSYDLADFDQPERIAEYVDKILRGARVADLPWDHPTKYELVINMRTAALLGLTIPQSLLMAAELIK